MTDIVKVGASPVAYEQLSTVTIGRDGDNPDAAIMSALRMSVGEYQTIAGVWG